MVHPGSMSIFASERLLLVDMVLAADFYNLCHQTQGAQSKASVVLREHSPRSFDSLLFAPFRATGFGPSI